MNKSAFTLVEMLVVIVIISILSTLGFKLTGVVKDRAMMVKDIGQLKEIGSALLVRAEENNGFFYSKNEIGNSSYRVYTDKKSLCQILLPYLDKQEVWTSPKPLPQTEKYKNSYAWSRSKNVTEKSIANNTSIGNTILLWNNHNYLTPSPANRVDPGTSGGPQSSPKNYHQKPWKNGKAQNWLYADGRVLTF